MFRSLRRFAQISALASSAIGFLGRATAERHEPVLEEDLGERPAAFEAVVLLSSGERLRGKLRLGGSGSLRIFDLAARQMHRVELERIESIRTFVEEERLEEAWAFEEGGSRKKIRLGWTYPRRAYRHEFQLRGGQLVEGHCQAAVFYLEGASGERKIVLPRYQKGERGETLESLVYPAAIELGLEKAATARRDPAPLASVSGKIEGLAALALVERSSCRSYQASVSRDGSFRAEGLLPGEFAVFALTGSEVIHGLCQAPDLQGDRLEAIGRKIAELAEFFPSRRIVVASGSARAPWLLLELERAGGTTLTDASAASFRIRRWELWALKEVGSEFEIASRAFLFRTAVPPNAPFPPASYRREPSYEKISLKAGKNAFPSTEGHRGGAGAAEPEERTGTEQKPKRR